MKINDRVRYSSDWLRNTGQFAGPVEPTSIGPHAYGNVIGTQPLGERLLVEVEWADGHVSKAISSNLEIVI